MAQDLVTLIRSYRYLKCIVDGHGHRMPHADLEKSQRDLDSQFLDIVMYEGNDPRITLAQMKFLMASLAATSIDEETRGEFDAVGQRLTDRLEKEVIRLTERVNAALPAPSADFRAFDRLTDRVGVIDRDYRYRYTNDANAKFHNSRGVDFVGRPSWDVTGTRFFERGNKQRFDACFAGQTVHCISAHPNRDPEKIYSVTYNPIRENDGSVHSLIMVSREISSLPIPAEQVTPLP